MSMGGPVVAVCYGPASPSRCRTRNHNLDGRENQGGRPGSGALTGPPRTWGGEKSAGPLSSGKVLSSAAQGRAQGHWLCPSPAQR